MANKLTAPILNQIPMTRVRLMLARFLYSMLHCALNRDNRVIKRHGISYDVDLAEGIDLSLFLFGNFQNHVTGSKHIDLKPNSVIFDVGANIGSMALQFAQRSPSVRVFAFEPTDFAYRKLLRNLSLNPELARQITPVQTFISDRTAQDSHLRAYSSWRIDGSAADAHPLHGGTIKSAAA